VAHDLRAPLRVIDAFSRKLGESWGDRMDDEGRRRLEGILASAGLMGQLIEALLGLSRMTRVSLRRSRADLTQLAQATMARLARSDTGRRVQATIPPGLVADGDPTLLGVMLDNLLGNAWKFTSKREDAQIELGVLDGNGVPTYFVRDNGAGFDMRHAKRLFGVFQRLHGDDEFEGTGIGLATVERIVRKHGGRIWAEAKPGRGATFLFTLTDGE
jgi:light-regulated signal transduction histidine kinase (bacteriophytochrome)